MNNPLHSLAGIAGTVILSVLLLALPAAVQAEAEEPVSGARAMVVQVEAEVIDVNLETRQVALKAPDGQMIYLAAQEQVVKLEDVSPGDRLVVDYLVAIEGEVREPTEEELADPFVIMEGAAVDSNVDHPAAGAARMVRAVCTIEAINTENNSVTIQAVNGMQLELHDVEPEKLAAVEVGQQMVVIYREALALSLAKVGETAAE